MTDPEGKAKGCNVFLTFYAISNISRKQNLEIQNNYFSFNVFFVFFFVCWKYCKVPVHLQLLVKFLISRFILFSTLKKIILKSAPSLTG